MWNSSPAPTRCAHSIPDERSWSASDAALSPSDEIERLIAFCEAPALLWRSEPAPTRKVEPFGIIA